jgi:outer membrane protein TolC
MKRLLLLSAFVLTMAGVHAQSTLSLGYGSNATDSIPADSVASGLARLAMNNPAMDQVRSLTEAAKYNYKAEKTAILDNVRISGNLNEFTITGNPNPTPLGGRGNAFFPRYNISAGIPLGIFVNRPKQMKAAFYRYQAQEDNLKVAQQDFRMQILTRYLDYLRNLKLYELQEEALQDASFAFTKTEESFSKGEVALDVYTATSKRFNSEQVQKISLERELIIGKAELEILLGMPLNEALAKVKQAYYASKIKR